MTVLPVPRARRPATAPSKADLDERDRYARLTAGSLDAVRGSAETWRNGLAAFITLVTTGVVIQGRDTTSGLADGWRALVTILIGGGLLLAVAGLWQTLAAEAGTDPRKQTLHDIRAVHGTLTAYELYLAARGARRLEWGRRAVAAAVTLLLAGIAATWWAPAPPGLTARLPRNHAWARRYMRHPAAGGLRPATPHPSRQPHHRHHPHLPDHLPHLDNRLPLTSPNDHNHQRFVPARAQHGRGQRTVREGRA